MNRTERFAKMLGIDIGEEFKMEGIFKLDAKRGLMCLDESDNTWKSVTSTIIRIFALEDETDQEIKGKYEDEE